jgi:transposase
MSHYGGSSWTTCPDCGEKQKASGGWVTCRECGKSFHS